MSGRQDGLPDWVEECLARMEREKAFEQWVELFRGLIRTAIENNVRIDTAKRIFDRVTRKGLDVTFFGLWREEERRHGRSS